MVTQKIVHRLRENKRTSGHVHVDRLAFIQFSRIKLVNIKKINQDNMVINLTVYTYVGLSKSIRKGQ